MNNKPRLYVVGGQWQEPDELVADWRESFSWADAICIVDDRHRTTWRNEGQYRKLQRQELQKAGIQTGDWVFVTSPDERLEVGAEKIIREEIEKPLGLRTYSFDLKEMFTPTEYRIDGIWGLKTRPRLYPYLPGQIFSTRRIQQSPIPRSTYTQKYKRLKLDLNIYHLKMIEPENREQRVEQYKKTDPNYQFQRRNNPKLKEIDKEGRFEKLGYDYLADLDGMILEELPKGREFTPKYRRYVLQNGTKLGEKLKE